MGTRHSDHLLSRSRDIDEVSGLLFGSPGGRVDRHLQSHSENPVRCLESGASFSHDRALPALASNLPHQAPVSAREAFRVAALRPGESVPACSRAGESDPLLSRSMALTCTLFRLRRPATMAALAMISAGVAIPAIQGMHRQNNTVDTPQLQERSTLPLVTDDRVASLTSPRR